MTSPHTNNRLWPAPARAMVQRLYEANASLDAILVELQTLLPNATWEMLANEIKRQGYRRSAPQYVSPRLRDEALFLKAFGQVRSGVERVGFVPMGTFKAVGYSMIGGRLYG